VLEVVVVGGVGRGHASKFITDSDLVELLIRKCLAKISHVSFLEACVEGIGSVSI
jgi:hypothetical protein